MNAIPPLSQSQPLEAPPPARGGCLKAGLIGCGAVALLCVLAFVGFSLYARKNPGFFLDIFASQIEKNYGPDVTEQDKTEFRKTVADVKEAFRSGRAQKANASGWNFSMKRNMSGKISHEELQEIIRTLRQQFGEEPATVPATTSPKVLPTPA